MSAQPDAGLSDKPTSLFDAHCMSRLADTIAGATERVDAAYVADSADDAMSIASSQGGSPHDVPPRLSYNNSTDHRYGL